MLIGENEGELTLEGRVWRGEAGHVEVGGRRLTLLVMLDVTAHKAFFHTFSGWLWAALVLCALLSGLLGWLLVRSGLRPLREVTQVAASVSASRCASAFPMTRRRQSCSSWYRPSTRCWRVWKTPSCDCRTSRPTSPTSCARH